MNSQKDNPYSNFKYYNLVMSLIQALQGFFILYLSNGFTFPITTSYLNRNSFLNIVTPKTVEIFRLPLAATVAFVLFVSATSHFVILLPKVYEWYINNLKKKINYLRWIEYSVSSATMIVLIALLSGVFDLGSLIAIFFLDSAMILFGLLSERLAGKDSKGSWSAFIFGCVLGAVPWFIICLYVFGAWQNQPNIIPSFVYRILLTIFIFFNSFAINALLWLLKIGPWKDYIFVEKTYLFLSLASKSVLAWQVFASVLM